MAGAVFTIYTDEACTQPLSVSNEDLTATSNDSGIVSFDGIPVRRDTTGTPLVYYMKETQAPEGYRQNNNTYKLVYNSNTKTFDVLTLDGQSSEQIVNSLLQPIELGVEKRWQDAAGNDITPDDSYYAEFTVTRTKSYTTPAEVVTGSEQTLQIRHLKNDDNWATSGAQIYNYLRGRTVTINYDYHGTWSNGKREYRYSTNGGNNWSYSGSIPESGSFDVQIPASGQYVIEFYDVNNAVTWTIDDGASPGETVVDGPDSYTCTLRLENGATSGTFDSGLTEYAGKFPTTETGADGVKYTYKYNITETSKYPSDTDTVYVDANGNVIEDISTVKIDDDYTLHAINRQRLDIPVEKYWEFEKEEGQTEAPTYDWEATFQLQYRYVDKDSGEALTNWEDVVGNQTTVTSANGGHGSFDGLPMYGIYDGRECRIQYSEREIAYKAWRPSDNEVMVWWQHPDYYENPVDPIGVRYSLHYVQDAGENGATVNDYKVILINTPENREITKQIDIKLEKTWPAGVTGEYANFVLKRYVREEYRNFPNTTTEWVNVTLNTGNDSPQTMRVPQGWDMLIFWTPKQGCSAEDVSFSNGVGGTPQADSVPSGQVYVRFTATQDMTVTVSNAGAAVGGSDGFRLSDANDFGDLEYGPDSSFEIPFTLDDTNSWKTELHHLTAIEEDTQHEGALEITRYVYTYYIQETGSSPEDYTATFTDNDNGLVLGDADHGITTDAELTAANHLKPGSLKITKNVTVNGEAPTATEAVLVDGEYTFVIEGVTGEVTEGQRHEVTVTVSGGAATTEEVTDLIPGPYTVTEQTPANGTSLVGSNGLAVTVEAGKTGDLVPDGAKTEFTNNIQTTSITFGKDWKQADKVTPLEDEGRENVAVTYTLMQRATNADGDIVYNDVYEGIYFMGGEQRTATAAQPAIFYPTQNTPVTITDLPTSGVINGEPVTFTYFATEAKIEGFIADVPTPVGDGSFTITNSVIPETSRPTAVTVEKKWEGDNAQDIGGVKFRLVQERAQLNLTSSSKRFYPVIIRLQDSDGAFMAEDIVVFVKNGTLLSIPVQMLSGSVLNPSWVSQENNICLSGESFTTTAITGARTLTLRIESLASLLGLGGDAYRWGTNWQVGTITAANNNGQVSDTPQTFIDQLEDGDLNFVPTGIEHEIEVNMPAPGVAEAVGDRKPVTPVEDEWKATISDLQYYEQGEDGNYYTYRYVVQEVAIIDAESKEVIETITNNADGTGGESLHFTVTYDNEAAGTVNDPLLITNTRRAETQIILKKVDSLNLNKNPLTADDLLDGASFTIEKYLSLNPNSLDEAWNSFDDHGAVNNGENGVFTFSGLLPGIYKIHEESFPTGYIQVSSDPFIRINDDFSIDLLDEDGNAIVGNATELVRIDPDTGEIIVGNTSGASLPYTGGSGTAVIYAAGLLLAGAAGLLLIRQRRRAE